MLKNVYRHFNRGEVDDLALSRNDVSRIQSSAALMENWLPLRLGPMVHANGVEDLGALAGEGIMIPFVKAVDDTALVELTDNVMRVWVNGERVERQDVAAIVPALNTWSNASGAGSTVTHGAVSTFRAAQTTQAEISTTFTGLTAGQEHGLRVVVDRGPINIRLGSSGPTSSDIFSGVLNTGTHTFSVSPDNTSFSIALTSEAQYSTMVSSVSFDGAGPLSIPTFVGREALPSVRWAVSGDVIFGAQDGSQFRIVRRGVRSWGFEEYLSNDGPFGLINTTNTSLQLSGNDGDISVTSSAPLFTPNHVNTLIRAVTTSQIVEASITENNSTDSIRVTGVEDNNGREFSISISGSFSGEVVLERSSDDTTWEQVQVYDENENTSFDDEIDNAVLFYRLTTRSGTGTANLRLSYSGGSSEGIARIVSVNSATSVSAIVLNSFGSTVETRDWYLSQWPIGGKPTSVMLYEGRLWFGGFNRLWGSVSDAYDSFDREIEGASRSILRTIGFGAVETIHWLAAAVRMAMGTSLDEVSVRSSSFGEVITQDNANLKEGTGQGARPIPPATADNNIYYAQRSGVKVYELNYNISNDSHSSRDLNYLNQDIGKAVFKRIAISRQPETRLYAVMEDGSAAVMLIENGEDVLCWSRRTFPFPAVDVVCLPSDGEDEVYFVLNTGTEYRLQRAAPVGKAHEYPVDMYKTSSTGLDHFEGQEVDIWIDGARQAPQTVTGGSVTATGANIVVGKRITAKYRSNKLGNYVDSTVLNDWKRVISIGLVGRKIWHDGLTYGRDEQHLYRLPEIYKGQPLTLTALIDEYDVVPVEFEGAFEADSRICLQADAPATIMSLVFTIDTPNDPTRR